MCFKLDRFIQEFILSIDVEEVNLIKLNNTLANFDLQRTHKTVSCAVYYYYVHCLGDSEIVSSSLDPCTILLNWNYCRLIEALLSIYPHLIHFQLFLLCFFPFPLLWNWNLKEKDTVILSCWSQHINMMYSTLKAA